MATAAAIGTGTRLVFLDLEATGFESPDIAQIAAVDLSGKYTFDEYVTPTKNFEAGATRVTGLSRGVDGGLYRASGTGPFAPKTKISSRPAGKVLAEFVNWLNRIGFPGEKKVLVAYSGYE